MDLVWGGVNTLAQSLHKIKNTKSKKEAKRLISKLKVYTISEQENSGIWISNNFPDLFYIVSPRGKYSQATWIGINSYIKGFDNTTISNDLIAKTYSTKSWSARSKLSGYSLGRRARYDRFLFINPKWT